MEESDYTMHIDHLPNELFFEIFEYLDLPTFKSCRLVSQKWKVIVMDAFRSKIQLIFPFTDESCRTAKNLTEEEVGLHVFDFTGKANDQISTDDAKILFENAETIRFSGNNIEPAEVTKILRCALDTVKTLSFQCTGSINTDSTRPSLEMKEKFNALVKLSIGYHASDRVNGPFNTFTDVLEKFGIAKSGPEFPSLQCLKLSFDGTVMTRHAAVVNVSRNDLFRNYLAVAKLILKYKTKLTDVIIERTFGSGIELCGRRQLLELNEPRMTEMQKCLEGFNELNLNRLSIYTGATANDWRLSTELVGRQRNLKDVLFQHLICAFDTEPVLIRMLDRIPANGSLLTSVEISLTIRTYGQVILGVDLGVFQVCTNLKKLWMVVQSRKWGRTDFRNVERLPRKIISLHFKNVSERYGVGVDQQILLSRPQMRWIIDHLLSLESIWVGLAFADENEGDVLILERANIDVELFGLLLAMPKIKDLRLDMVMARQYAGFPGWGLNHRSNTLVSDIQKYTEVCEATANVSATARLIDHPVPFGWTELAINKTLN